MKKIIAILAVLMLIPFTAFGLETLSEDALDDVTGQAGVSIAVDINVNMDMDTLAWGDTDGLGTATATQGWIGMSDFNITNLRIRLDTMQATAAGGPGLELFTIDVATTTADTFTQRYDFATDAFVDSAIVRPSGTTFVRIGLGSQLITMDEMTGTVALSATAAGVGNTAAGLSGDPLTTGVLGNFAIHGLAMAIEGSSYVDISAHGHSGVTIDLAVRINTISMDACSWGDADGMGDGAPITMNAGIGDAHYNAPGFPGTSSTLVSGAVGESTGGYVGLRNMEITNLVVAGQVMIDVATVGTTVAGTILGIYHDDIQADAADTNGNTAVIIRLNGMQIGMEMFTAEIALSNASDLGASAAAGGKDHTVMGSIYMSDMDVTVDGWVAIFAH